MRSPVPIAAAFAIASCTRPVQPPGAARAQELSGYIASQPQSCVSKFSNQNLRVIDSRTIAYGFGRTIAVNHLPGACLALTPYNTIIRLAGSGSIGGRRERRPADGRPPVGS